MENFHMLGDIERMEDVLSGAWVFVGVSRAATEAMACGIPTVLSGDEGYLGLVSCEDDLKKAAVSNYCCRGEDRINGERLFYDLCKALSLSFEERENMGRLLSEYVKENHSAAIMARKTAKV